MITAFVTWHAATRHELTEGAPRWTWRAPRRAVRTAHPASGSAPHRPTERDAQGRLRRRRHQDRQDPGQQGRCSSTPSRPLPARGVRPLARWMATGRRVVCCRHEASAAGAPPNASRRPGADDTPGSRDYARRRGSHCGAEPASAARRNDGGCTHRPVRPPVWPIVGSRDAQSGGTGCRPWPSGPTEEQAAVIASPPGPLVVVAGAGAGTETMAARVVGWWPTATRTPVR